jgi:hypothetical protein
MIHASTTIADRVPSGDRLDSRRQRARTQQTACAGPIQKSSVESKNGCGRASKKSVFCLLAG